VSRTLLEIADELRALGTTGLHFGESEFDRERYAKLLALAARLASEAGAGPVETLEQVFGSERGYVTPKLDVRLALFRGAAGAEHVLMVRERSDGRWCLPGGYIDVGESASEAAARETQEEAGVIARARQLVGLFDNRLRPDVPPHLFQIYKLVFLGELVDPEAEPEAGSEADAAAFHPVDALPELSIGRTHSADVACALRAHRGEQTRTVFDLVAWIRLPSSRDPRRVLGRAPSSF
jgi:ADP-ribose pyrophosphatase YjhB (NUDIX family)